MGVHKDAPQVWKLAVAYATLGTHRVAPKVGLHNPGGTPWGLESDPYEGS